MVFIDANIILELAAPQRKRAAAAAQILGSYPRLYISTLTGHLIWYFGRKFKLDDQCISELLNDYQLLPLTPADYAWAVAHEQGKDFEDALQVAVALNNHCDRFITLDRKLANRYEHLPITFVIP